MKSRKDREIARYMDWQMNEIENTNRLGFKVLTKKIIGYRNDRNWTTLISHSEVENKLGNHLIQIVDFGGVIMARRSKDFYL